MKTKESKKKTPEMFFIDEGKFNRAIGEMKGYCNSANKIIAILKGHELSVDATLAEKAISASLDELTEIVLNEQKKRLRDLSDIAREQLLVKPNLSSIQHIRNSMTQTAAYNAGFIPGVFMKFEKDKFIVDESSLKEHFTIHRNGETDKLEKLVNSFLRSWKNLKTYSDEQRFDNVINVYGILHFDPYTETFTFNKRSSDLKLLEKNKK